MHGTTPQLSTSDLRPTDRSPWGAAWVALQLLLAIILVGLTACGGGLMGGPGPTADRPANSTVSGEIERVETYANEIDIWTDERRIVTVRYDDSTAVYYQGERYTPADLESGDIITASVERASNGNWMARRIDVDRGRQDRADGSGDRSDPNDRYDDRNDDEVATLTGEVERVDASRREIEIETTRGSETFGYRSDTVVYYQGERYEVSNLEPGDVIRTRVERDSRGDWVTDNITVERSRQERGIEDGPAGGPADGGIFGRNDPDDDQNDRNDDRYGDLPADALRYAGTVQDIDTRRGEFVLRTERYGVKTIVMPYGASRADRDAFDNLRRGDRVEIEVEPLARDRAELLRFGWR